MERVTLEFPEAMIVHRHPLSVRITDMNYGRHLAHDAVVTLMAEARAQAFAALGLPEWDIDGYPSVVADLSLIFQREARFPDTLTIETAIPAPEGKALVVFHRILNQQREPVATARVTMLLIDTAVGKPVAVPMALARALDAARGA
ncbi:acyl-CoA thioesterase [Halomonas sp. HNIBRBA4712]|uniref:acyl-CoA thioesterase n=1 Tax=Halomonas sp. HNIBRBA4712 TaxID=3373087 RepID=UPI003744E510